MPWVSDGTSWVNNNNIGPSVVINDTNSLFGSNQTYPIELNTGSGTLNLSNNSGTTTNIDVSDSNATYIQTLDLSNKLHWFTMYKEIDNSYIKIIVSDNECLFIDPAINPLNSYRPNDSRFCLGNNDTPYMSSTTDARVTDKLNINGAIRFEYLNLSDTDYTNLTDAGWLILNKDGVFYYATFTNPYKWLTRENTQQLDDFEPSTPSPGQLIVCNGSGKYEPGPLATSFLTTSTNLINLADMLFVSLTNG